MWQCFVLSLPHFTTERMAAYEHHVQKGQRGDERPEINSKKKKKSKQTGLPVCGCALQTRK